MDNTKTPDVSGVGEEEQGSSVAESGGSPAHEPVKSDGSRSGELVALDARMAELLKAFPSDAPLTDAVAGQITAKNAALVRQVIEGYRRASYWLRWYQGLASSGSLTSSPAAGRAGNPATDEPPSPTPSSELRA